MATITACVVWLHGDGEEPHEWYARFKEGVSKLRMPWVEFSFPKAPRHNWFGVDLPILSPGAEDAELLATAVAEVHAHIAQLEQRGIAPSRVVLGGYGAGAALALLAGAGSAGSNCPGRCRLALVAQAAAFAFLTPTRFCSSCVPRARPNVRAFAGGHRLHGRMAAAA